MWLDSYEHDIEFNLAASTGPVWNVDELLAIAGDEAVAGSNRQCDDANHVCGHDAKCRSRA